ncbi:tail fiber domain-containing protein [Streptomyces sp. GMY02]|uniref:tail fiber domain-containing protein n=1 Tax=Streptomyces sp. GMY02 TaxID=1333528 RepID=UPI001C2BE27D|nr:tail fiber domain-containing protein [Streptomyces sp. GMY02]QXE37117.1 tail fiber domain-containing protein [Streptomyces sp. GMY02]
MAKSSYPFDGQAATESQYSRLFREFQDSGVVGSAESTDLKVFADGSGMKVFVQPGFAILRGHAFFSTGIEPLDIAAADSSERRDRVVLRLDPTANSIALTVLEGVAGGEAIDVTQTDTGIYELSLGLVRVSPGVTNVAADAIIEGRRYSGSRVGTWTTNTRPATPRVSQLGLNRTTKAWEYWDGAAWADLAPTVTWSNISGRPTAFAPAAHSHGWSDLTDKPTTFPPSSHTHDWGAVSGKPTTFPPVTHSHSWSSITGRPSTFAPSSHSHGSYLEAGDTISWANGTKRVHNDSVSGSGTYYAVWVQGDGTFARNTSSLRFKQNVRDHGIAPKAVLALRPRIYDRRPKEGSDDYQRNEFGLIAEEVAEHLPEIVTRDENGIVDALRYDLLGVALLPVVQNQAKRIERLEALVEELRQ